jgi:hypothetical protein
MLMQVFMIEIEFREGENIGEEGVDVLGGCVSVGR